MKLLAALLVIAGLVLAIAPQFTNCEANSGKMSAASPGFQVASASTITLAAMTTPAAAMPKMKCLWTARAGIVVGAALVVSGALLFFSRRRETIRALGILSALMGLFAILLPSTLIGTCAPSTSVCNTTMAPIMYSAGGLALAVGVIVVVVNELRRGGAAMAEAAA